MTSMSLMFWGAAGMGLLAVLFLLHELRNAPYEDEPERERALTEVEKQRLRFLSMD